MSSDDLWRPPDAPSAPAGAWPEPPLGWGGQPGAVRRARWWIAPALLVPLLLVVLAVAVPRLSTANGGQHRTLPRTAEEARAQEGRHITVETGTTNDGRTYSIEVSVSTYGDYCDFVTVQAPASRALAGGGGGCGPGSPMGFSYGSDSIVHGITDGRIATVEVLSPAGPVTVSTKPLPKEFDGHRHFVAVLPGGVKPTELIGRRADGSVFSRQSVLGR